jgi:GntR family transcriptional regulator, sialic acid-inducible nan operon repressor
MRWYDRYTMKSSVIRRHRLYEEVASHLEAMIQDGVFAAGDQLPSERALMQQFGVGRTAIREALFALQKMGLVALSSGERARVTEPTPTVVIESLSGSARQMLSQPDGVRHFQQARDFFEVGLARHAAVGATEADLRLLAEALAENKASIGDVRRFEATDVGFHYVLAVIPRNPIFLAIHQAMAEWLTEQRRITLRSPAQNELAYRAHEQIYKAIAARDANRAERLIRAHLGQVSALYWKMLEGDHERLRHHRGLSPEARNVRSFPGPHRRERRGVGS